MKIFNRDLVLEDIDFNKITTRISKAIEYCSNVSNIDPVVISIKVINNIRDRITSRELDEITAQICMNLSLEHHNWGVLGSRIIISNHQKSCKWSFSEAMEYLWRNTDSKGKDCPLIDNNVYTLCSKYEHLIKPERDFLIDYFGFKTLEKSYLLKTSNGLIRETPQYLWLRVAIGIWGDNTENVKQTYDMLSTKMATHATPTLFNAGTPNPNCLSCFLLGTTDSVEGIYKTIGDCAVISKWSGGIGVHVSNIRCKGSYIRGTGGKTDGIIPMLKVYNDTATYIDQCFTPDTKIHTREDLKRIKDIKLGDEVMTLDGTYKEVKCIIVNEFKGSILKINTVLGPLRCTDTHQIYISEHSDFVSAKDILINDHLVFPGGKLNKVLSIETVYYSGKIYDLNIKDNHNYLTFAGIVHNSGKRNGSFAIYLEPHHGDIFEFLKAMRNHGSEESLARDLFYALWVSDLFMKAVKEDNDWYLMCPDECPGLSDTYGEKFEELYNKYITEGLYRQKVKARDIWKEILKSQIESGLPYIGYKDHVNRKNNQINVGVIKSSNLCIEINEYSDSTEYACCCLSSICLPMFLSLPEVKNITIYTIPKCEWCDILKVFMRFHGYSFEEINSEYKRTFKSYPQVFIDNENVGGFEKTIEYLSPKMNYEKLRETVRTIVRNLNRIIDINFYPVPETKKSNIRHRPLGIGVQGLADVFIQMWIPFTHSRAKELNKEIFEMIYYYAMEMSCELAEEQGPYETFKGSPLSNGKFQFNLWGVKESSLKCNWKDLRKKINSFGVRNSLLVALMPTASTSQIMGNNEAMEPITSNMYMRKTLAGEFIVMNEYLIRILEDLSLWNEEMKNRIMFHRGSIQNIKWIPRYIREVFKTVWEISNKDLIDMAADRGPFICQTQSMNLFVEKPDFRKLTAMHFYSHSKGLKTGIYYLRSKPAMNSQSFTIDPKLEEKFKSEFIEDDTICMSCTS
jgi:ribonucleoside-diphosphate reductase alpha subunit